MQLFSRKKAFTALSLGALFALGACGDDVTVPVAPDAPVVISITPPSATLNIGESSDFAVQITGGPTTGAPTLQSCTSSNSSVATAAVQGSACRVTAVASGNVTVTAAASTGNAAAASITVNPAAAAISNLTTSPTTAGIAVGQTLTIVPNVTKAGSAVAVTYTYATSNSSIASLSGGVVTAVAPGVATITVTANGSGTGFTTTALTAGVTVTVTAAPAALTGLTVQPTSLAMALSSTATLTANVTTAAGITCAPGTCLTYTASTGGVVSVTNAGVVTALTPGTATVTVTATSVGTSTLAPSTLTVVVPVTVSPAANVTIATVTQGPTVSNVRDSSGLPVSANDGIQFSANGQVDQPVDLTNTRDQIQVKVNLQPNGQAVRSVRAYVCDASGNACGLPAAEQTFANDAANAGLIQLFVNTADFTADFDAGTSSVKFLNGQHTIKVSVRTPDGTELYNATNNNYILNFNNIDGWAVKFGSPQNTATRNGPPTGTFWNYFGGPGATGASNIRPVPVFYTPGRTVQRVNIGLSNCGVVNGPLTAAPYTTTYGSGVAYDVSCAGYEHAQTTASDFPVVTGTQDNSNNPAPTVSFAAGYRTSAAVAAVAAIRLDYAGPTFSINNPATKWASGALNNFNWRTSTTAPVDNGVGPKATSTFTYTYTGCGATATAMPTAGAVDIPECGLDYTSDVYQVTGTGTDLLGNTTVSSTAASPSKFAIDNIAPLVRYTVGSVSLPATPATPGQGPGSFQDTTTFTVSTLTGTDFAFTVVPVAGDTIFGADALDERSGLNTASNLLARANQAAPTGVCQRGGTGIGLAFITAPGCSFAAATIGSPAMVDGYRPITTRILGDIDFGIGGTPIEAYYTYAARVVDRAGNSATTPFRRVLFSNTQPMMTGLGLPSTVTAAGPNVFTPNFSEVVEGWVSNLALGYGLSAISGTTPGSALQDPTATDRATLLYPAMLMNARFNDAIQLNGNYTTGTPFASGTNVYTNIEYARGIDSLIAGTAANPSLTTTQSRPDSAYARVVNAGGNPSLGGNNASAFFGVQLLTANVGNDTTAWGTFNTNLIGWYLGTIASAWNAPANGVKAIVTANTNQINSPFTRIDYYEFQLANPTAVGGTATGQWVFIGSVDGTATPCVSAASTCPVYIADNGATRVWTYRLTTRTNGVNGMLPGSTLTALVAGANRFMAIASNGAKGRVLATNPLAANSTINP